MKRFFNSRERNLSFDDAIDKIIAFIKQDKYANYKLAIGTDSQVIGNKTCFATAILITRKGRGTWGCVTRLVENRRYNNLREKISKETYLTLELLLQFNGGALDKIYEEVLPYLNKGADIEFEVHLDIGERGATRVLIREMTKYFSGYIDKQHVKIKPDSVVASWYANKYSKSIGA